ncbi:MAG: amino acid permease [Crocinitomicaceae bacterium]|nr:amino acid permease [Crocinitomicaceae bacterium]
MTKKYTRSVATNMVIANMIGTGIFTSLGFQVLDTGIPDPFSILIIWLLGGVVALCGASVYAEVASRINRSGGEYTFLSEIYHPLLGFISGWISLFVGFSAAIAALALAAGEYFLPVIGFSKETALNLGLFEISIAKLIGCLLLILVSLVHFRGVKFGGIFQNYMTYIKLVLIGSFLIIPFLFASNYEASGINFSPTDKTLNTIFSTPFAGALVYVMFAYSGWNASAYIVGNLENPRKNLPFSLLVGTIIVTIIYILLNFIFMYVARFDELALQVDLGNVVANKILGNKVGVFFSFAFSLALISGISAMFIAGPRVAEQIGKDYKTFKILGKQNKQGVPKYGIVFILTISILLTFFSSFKEIILYIGLTLMLSSMLTVFGVFILRYRERKADKTPAKNVVKTWGYPITPIVFILISLWIIYFFVAQDIKYLVWSLATIIPAIVIYYLTRNNDTEKDYPLDSNIN